MSLFVVMTMPWNSTRPLHYQSMTDGWTIPPRSWFSKVGWHVDSAQTIRSTRALASMPTTVSYKFSEHGVHTDAIMHPGWAAHEMGSNR